MSVPAIPVIGDLMRFTLSPILSRLIYPLLLRKIFGPAAVSPGFRDFPVWMMLRSRQLRAAAVESATMIPTAAMLGPRFKELRMPVMLIAGRGDRVARARWHSQRVHERIPTSELRLVAGAGHMVHHTAPDDVKAAIDWAARAV